MSSIESRVAQLKFDNSSFESGVQKTLASLQKLNTGLKLDGATKGLDSVGEAAKRFNLGRIADSVQNISSKFSAMGVIAATAIATITQKAIALGTQLAKTFTINPIMDGFHEYETNLNAIQTILSNTASAGTNLKDVNRALNELNHYSDQTIYNFSEMAKNIGTFTAAGVDLKTAVGSIKGIANLAALSGSNSQQASTAMYQLSQAISAGRVSLEDWNSVVNAGMGGTVFQRALAQTAESVGTLDKGAVKLKGSMKNVTIGGKSFRESITAKPGEKSWLTSDVLTKTLEQFTGDLSDAQLKAQGFNKEQIKAIQSQAKMAKNAATQVKTFSQLMGTLSESAGSGWTQTWQYVFGDFDQARTLFTNVNNVLGGFISANANARNKVLKDWNALGGRTVIIKAIGNAFHALIQVLKPIRDAFRQIFPATTGKQLYDLSVSLLHFTETLKIGAATSDKLKRTFAGVFAVFGIGWEIIKLVASTFGELFSAVSGGSGSFLNVTAGLGDFLVRLHTAIKEGTGLKAFFIGLGRVLAYPIKALSWLASILSSGFSNVDSKSLDKLKSRLSPLGAVGNIIAQVWARMGKIMSSVWKTIQPLAGQVGKLFQKLSDTIQKAMGNGNYAQILDTINTGLLGGLVLILRKFMKSGLGGINIGDGLFSSIKDAFGGLTDTLSTMQQQLKAGILIKIAAAIALLTVSVVALSMIDTNKLTKALAALAVMFTQLIVVMAIFAKATAGAGILKLPLLAAGLIALAIAIDILVLAVYALSRLNWEELAKGLLGVTVLIGALVLASRGMASGAKGMIASGAGLILLALGIKILASAVTDLAGLSWGEMAKGLVGVGALLAALGLFTKFASLDKGGLLTGAGIVLLATGIKILASALVDIASMSWVELAKGLVGMAVGLALMGAALALIPPTSIFSAAAVLVVATSLNILALAMNQLGGMSWEEIGKSLVVLAGSLTIIAVAMSFMTTAIAGAAALLIISASLAVLTPVLIALGTMSWEGIAKGLTALAGAFVIIGLAGAILTPVVPTLLLLGAAIALLGLGMLAAGTGMLLFSVALTALSVSGAVASAALVGIITTLLGAVPKILDLIGQMLVGIAKVIIVAAPAIFQAGIVVITQFLKAIVFLGPKILSSAAQLLLSFLNVFVKYVPKLIQAGANLIVAIFNGVAKNLPRIISAATNVIVAFLNGLAKNLPRIVDAGVRLIIAFVNSLATSIRAHSSELNAAGANLAQAIISGMGKGLLSGVGVIAAKASQVAHSALAAAKKVLGIHSPSKEFEKIGKYVNDGFVKGLNGNSSSVSDAFNKLKDYLKSAISNSSADVDRLTARLKKLTKARHKDTSAIREARKELAQAKREESKEKSALSYMSKYLTDERDHLKRLANDYDKVASKLQNATQALGDAKKTRDDYKASITAQYSDLPEITATTNLKTYEDDLSAQIQKTKAFANVLQKLRKLGLNNTLYKEFLSKGPDALPFLTQILDQGAIGVKNLNGLDTSLEKAAGSLGSTASTQLYQAAVDSAQGLVDGLKKQEKAIEKQMDKIADSMVARIKKRLGIKSPSREFMKVGDFSGKGLAQGLAASSSAVQLSAEKIGKDAIFALQKSISGMAMALDTNIDLQPTIRPLVDLTDVENKASAIGDLLNTKQVINADTAYTQATSARAGYQANMAAKYDSNTSPVSPVATVSYVQNNTSPKALSTAEIYRQTKNQLSVAKGAVAK